MNDLLSVVIPAFNAAPYVRTAVESVLGQTHANLELIVVDDGSTDETADIVRSIEDERLRLLTGPNHGVSAARNRGLGHVRGMAVAFLDADDFWFPNKLRVQLQALGRDGSIAAVGSRMRYVSPSGKWLGVAGEMVSREDQARIQAASFMPFPLSSVLFRRGPLDLIGGFDESLTQAEDLHLLSRIARHGSIVAIPDVLGAYRIHAASASARDLYLQKLSWRFVEQRVKAEKRGEVLTWETFRRTHPPSWRDRYIDLVAARYRSAGLYASSGRWLKAFGSGAVAALLGPRYTFARLRRHRPWARTGEELNRPGTE